MAIQFCGHRFMGAECVRASGHDGRHGDAFGCEWEGVPDDDAPTRLDVLWANCAKRDSGDIVPVDVGDLAALLTIAALAEEASLREDADALPPAASLALLLLSRPARR